MVPALFLSIVTLISFHIPMAQAMPIGISILLAYSVLTIRCAFYINFATKLISRFLFYFILRLNDALPNQSKVVPLLSTYFILSMVFSITGMIWFSSLKILVYEAKNIELPVQEGNDDHRKNPIFVLSSSSSLVVHLNYFLLFSCLLHLMI